MKAKALSFQFKGSRTYVHGTDMWTNSIQAIKENWNPSKISKFDFTIHKMTDHNLVLDSKSPTVAKSAVGSIDFECDGEIVHLQLTESPSKAEGRYAYDEDSIAAACEIGREARTIRLTQTSPFSDIETLVAMTKSLHLDVFPDANGKWVFCRLQADSWPLAIDRADLTIRLVQAFGTRLTKSVVVSGNKEIGTIFFSAKVSP